MRVTPHTSHDLGLVEGELHCLVCMVGHDWPLIEEPCAAPDIAPATRAAIVAGRHRRHEVVPQMSTETVLEAQRLRADGRRWRWISERLGRPEKSLQRAVRFLERGGGRVAARVKEQAHG